MASTTYHTVDATLTYAKVFEGNRDMGNDKVSHDETDGLYSVEAIITDETKEAMVDAGVKEVQLGYQQFKPTEDGNWKYRFKRPHKSKWLKEDDGSQKMVGQPIVFFLDKSIEKMRAEGGTKLWDHFVVVDPEADGYVGNGTTARIKFSLYQGAKGKTIVQLESIGILDFVPYRVNLEEQDESNVYF